MKNVFRLMFGALEIACTGNLNLSLDEKWRIIVAGIIGFFNK
jgi:hypothetical protein